MLFDFLVLFDLFYLITNESSCSILNERSKYTSQSHIHSLLVKHSALVRHPNTTRRWRHAPGRSKPASYASLISQTPWSERSHIALSKYIFSRASGAWLLHQLMSAQIGVVNILGNKLRLGRGSCIVSGEIRPVISRGVLGVPRTAWYWGSVATVAISFFSGRVAGRVHGVWEPGAPEWCLGLDEIQPRYEFRLVPSVPQKSTPFRSGRSGAGYSVVIDWKNYNELVINW
jgi:hypothetical protein